MAAALAERPRTLSIGVGPAVPLSGVSFGSIGGGTASDGDWGVNLGARYLQAVSPRWSAGVDVSYLSRTGTPG